MKHLGPLIVITTISLFVVGFSIGLFTLGLTETYIGKEVIVLSPLDSLTPGLSLGLLLAFCSVSTGAMLWSYIKTNLPYSQWLIFTLGLFASLVSALLGIGLHLRQLRFIESQFEVVGSTALSVSIINYFSWGSAIVFFLSGTITIFFLWISDSKENQIDTPAVGQNTSRKYLIIGTVVFFVFMFISFVGFLCRMLPTIL